MNIDERVKKAYALHHSGYNCAQAVLGAYVDLFDLDMDRAMTIAYGFGGGVGMTREICGTLDVYKRQIYWTSWLHWLIN